MEYVSHSQIPCFRRLYRDDRDKPLETTTFSRLCIPFLSMLEEFMCSSSVGDHVAAIRIFDEKCSVSCRLSIDWISSIHNNAQGLVKIFGFLAFIFLILSAMTMAMFIACLIYCKAW